MPIDSPPSRSSASQRDLHVGGTLGDVAALRPPFSGDSLAPENRELPVLKPPASSDVPQPAPLSDWQLLRRIASVAGFVLVNLWLVYHLAGIVLAPWSVPPSSR